MLHANVPQLHANIQQCRIGKVYLYRSLFTDLLLKEISSCLRRRCVVLCCPEPREAPSDVKASGISASEVRVTWRPPIPGPGRPERYEVCCDVPPRKHTHAPPPLLHTLDCDCTKPLVISGLQPFSAGVIPFFYAYYMRPTLGIFVHLLHKRNVFICTHILTRSASASNIIKCMRVAHHYLVISTSLGVLFTYETYITVIVLSYLHHQIELMSNQHPPMTPIRTSGDPKCCTNPRCLRNSVQPPHGTLVPTGASQGLQP